MYFAEPILDNCCCLEVMALERRVLVLPIEDVGRKLLGCAVAHGILEHIMIANGRFLFVTLVHETRVPVGRMRLPETVFTDWRLWTQSTQDARLLITRAFCSLLTLDACGISR